MKLFKTAFLITVTTLATCTQAQNTSSDMTLFYGGDILTLNPEHPNAEALLIKNDEIAAVGTLSGLKDTAKDAHRIDLQGKTLLPGFIDSHVHVRELGMDRIKANLVGVKNIEDIVVRLQAHYANPEPGEWLIGQGWDEGYFGSIGYPDRAKLDAAFPDNPVKLESLHGFAGLYNGAALEIAGMTNDTPDPDGGTINHREDGSLTGTMLVLAQDLVNTHVPDPDQKMIETAIIAGLTEMAEAGVTSIHEAGMEAEDVTAFQALAEGGKLPIRVYGLLNGNDEALMSKWFDRGILDDPSDWLDIRSIKVYFDGSLGSRTALMQAPYSDKPDEAKPTSRISLENIDKLAIRAVDKKFQMAVHAIGDEGNDCTIASYELRLSPRPDFDHRWRIEHAQVVLPNFYDRMAALDVIASMQSSHAVGDSVWAEDRIGPKRIKDAYAWQKILAAGGRVMINSDLPGEPWTPMETLYFAVTRKHLDGTPPDGWYADQALSVDEALHAMTVESAYSAFQDDRLGTLEAGKWADFVILDKNPHDISAGNLKDIKVLETWVAGKKMAFE